ncbi:Dachshund-like protein 1 [Heterocephalus glaber]|uniref:Dachshund-like protein 1 n=1 Tax=Heterocephalus glaber TaxID=10181 RepID=G5B869_HETGA|nr:Dachshund-like protein 1 [Heterocephalus glaber]
MVDLRGAKVASFTVEGCELICLPQAFDLFLKHLVGGLHTVYTKLKRLEITPVVCNVEQVRILRGLGAIQPGVNRCKLISRKDFETLYNDCTNARSRAPPRTSGHLLRVRGRGSVVTLPCPAGFAEREHTLRVREAEERAGGRGGDFERTGFEEVYVGEGVVDQGGDSVAAELLRVQNKEIRLKDLETEEARTEQGRADKRWRERVDDLKGKVKP